MYYWEFENVELNNSSNNVPNSSKNKNTKIYTGIELSSKINKLTLLLKDMNFFSNIDGVSCYANAVIQCLLNCEMIRTSLQLNNVLV